MITSLYHSLKSLARGVMRCSSLIPLLCLRFAEARRYRRELDPFFLTRCEIADHRLSLLSLLRADHHRPPCRPAGRDLELAGNRLLLEREFYAQAPVAQRVGQFQ